MSLEMKSHLVVGVGWFDYVFSCFCFRLLCRVTLIQRSFRVQRRVETEDNRDHCAELGKLF